MNTNVDIEKSVRLDVENRLHEIFRNTNFGEWAEKIIEYAVQDVFETSALGEGESYYSSGDITLGCQRALLHFVGHPDY